jgi:hypothetical protein
VAKKSLKIKDEETGKSQIILLAILVFFILVILGIMAGQFHP